MHRLRTPSLTVFFSLCAAFLLPYAVSAAGIFNGTIVPGQGTQCYCFGSAPDYGCILQLIQNVMNAAVSLGVLLCVLWIAYAGFSMMISGGVAEARSVAKIRLMNAVVGIAVILCSWLIIDFVMKTIYQPTTAFSTDKLGPWNSILAGSGNDYCIKINISPEALVTNSVDLNLSGGGVAQGGSSGSGTSNVGAGSCTVANVGPCSVAALSSTCFSSGSAQASRICNRESGGNPRALSTTDKVDSGHGSSYSVGLWQINLTVHKVAGLNCPAAFSGTCSAKNKVGDRRYAYCPEHIINEPLYQQCVTAAQNPANNMAYACSLYGNGSFSAWNNECHI